MNGRCSVNKLLILDIDETLLHATQEHLGRDWDFETEIYLVYKRLYVDEFLAFCFDNCDIAVWTSAGKDFASSIVDSLISKYGSPKFFGECSGKAMSAVRQG